MSAFRILLICLSVTFVVSAQDAHAQRRKRPTATARPKSGLEQSKRFKAGKSKTELDFDEASIEGQRKDPFGTLLNTREQNFNRGFIKLRTDWHDHMTLGAMGMSQ